MPGESVGLQAERYIHESVGPRTTRRLAGSTYHVFFRNTPSTTSVCRQRKWEPLCHFSWIAALKSTRISTLCAPLLIFRVISNRSGVLSALTRTEFMSPYYLGA